MRVINPKDNGDTEMATPSNVLYCGTLKSLKKDQASAAIPKPGGNLKVSSL
ncbi:hypothetical protein SLEP1_g28078 [Rubroshorea leprosula]|uniref:Uncharacterized protein n=1 Tax=Rubroshorea leprosula TaxID=152421 RepID=A0AAV5K275_9ROSI|nr:hypothetical protein SLEP1_g28078 [Rubroshorea leprosula]